MSVATAEATTTPQQLCVEYRRGDEALGIIDMRRNIVGDTTRLQEFDEEFPFLADQLGSRAVAILDLTENEAGAFKWRGAMYAVHRAVEQGATSVWTNSAGNHARGILLAARTYGIDADIRMPSTVSAKKRAAASELWPGGKARTTLAGHDFASTVAYSKQHPGTGVYAHPFDDEDVMLGQGTVVDDLLRLQPDTTDVVVPVGGGGLIGGVTNRLVELGRTDVTVHGVLAEGSDSLARSLANNGPGVKLASNPNRRFEGSCVPAVAARAVDLCMKYPNLELHNVQGAEVERLISEYDYHRRMNWLQGVEAYEPTTLVAIEALAQIHGERLVVLGTGRNAPLYPPMPEPARVHVWN